MKTEVGPEVDWWCLGTIIYEMVTGFPPFYEEEQPKEVLLHRIKTEQPKWKFMVGKELKDLLMRLLDKNRQKRLGHLGAQTVKDHPWFKGVKWEVLLRR
jgi:serine/threonine protein kinase